MFRKLKDDLGAVLFMVAIVVAGIAFTGCQTPANTSPVYVGAVNFNGPADQARGVSNDGMQKSGADGTVTPQTTLTTPAPATLAGAAAEAAKAAGKAVEKAPAAPATPPGPPNDGSVK